ncbi:MAG: 2-hydroxy-acid oxidase, partial [Oceanospirillaceae bacterium]|nr:2-hydroxy-acid oxidase [Oceanospirillaceae bacterium]
TEDRNELWTARHNAYFAAQALKPGSKAITTDVCVPISRLADCILAAEAAAKESDLLCPIVGHVGDGNFHLLIVFNPAEYEELEAARKLSAKVVEGALAVGGTCTGEHGIGSGKKEYLRTEHGSAVEIMATLKRALDPNNIMNPDKVLDI